MSKFKYWFIWLWYNDITRVLWFTGIPLPIILFGLWLIGWPAEWMRWTITIIYLSVLALMFGFNDHNKLNKIELNVYGHTKLNKIELNVYRKPLVKKDEDYIS